MIRIAQERDIPAIADIYEHIHEEEAAGRMSIGWQRGVYPTEKTAQEGLARGDLYVLEDQGQIVAAAVINRIQVPEYADCSWEFAAEDDKVMVLHTLVVDPEQNGKGYARRFIAFYEEYALAHNCHELRMDTQVKNRAARAMYAKHGFTEPGIVSCSFNGIPRVQLVCLEKRI